MHKETTNDWYFDCKMSDWVLLFYPVTYKNIFRPKFSVSRGIISTTNIYFKQK